MASERWKVVGDTYCEAWLKQATEPESEFLPCTKFLMDIKATVRRCLQQQLFNSDDDISLFLEEDIWSVDENDAEVEIQSNNPYDVSTRISQILSQLQVPRQAHQDMIDTVILPKAFKAARAHYAAPKVLHMVVHVDVCVVDTNDLSDDFGGTDVLEFADDGSDLQPAFVPASTESIEKLERARVEVLNLCSICMEEILVGSEATRMPCSHLYHGGCIVEWLQKSRSCPLCRYSLLADQ